MRPLLYVETSVVSYLTGRRSQDLIVAAHQELTRKWWSERGRQFDLVISELVYREASGGDAEAAGARIRALDGLRILKIGEDAFSLAERLLAKGPIPRAYAEDALHISVAAVNGADYLLTWNCKHLANAAHRAIVESVVEEAGYACPIICTPEELMED
jgi:predicted nucleic acid-binding protein